MFKQFVAKGWYITHFNFARGPRHGKFFRQEGPDARVKEGLFTQSKQGPVAEGCVRTSVC